ncbi:hypothetical protein PISMIDRAFT_658755, partial [Pisolithus microcarpus 441]
LPSHSFDSWSSWAISSLVSTLLAHPTALLASSAALSTSLTSYGTLTIPFSTSGCSLSSGSPALELGCSCSSLRAMCSSLGTSGTWSSTSMLRDRTCWAAPTAASALSLLLASALRMTLLVHLSSRHHWHVPRMHCHSSVSVDLWYSAACLLPHHHLELQHVSRWVRELE